MLRSCLIWIILNQLQETNEYGFNVVDNNHIIELPIQDPTCHDFIYPGTSNTYFQDTEFSLQSPKYPNNYPTEVDCIHIIKAPSPYMIIQLQFREVFAIEESKNCEHDFLQINDGPFGFRKLIKKLCGNEVNRDIIESSGRYLWLRFHSDKTLTNKGFKFVYKFIFTKSNPEYGKICYRRLTIPNGHSALLTSDNLKNYQSRNNFKGIQECVFDIFVKEESYIFISMVNLNSTGMNKLGQSITIFDRTITAVTMTNPKTFFLIEENSNFVKTLFRHHSASVRIVFKNINSLMTFKFVFTSLVKKPNEKCPDDEFFCDGFYCISNKLFCNKYQNCPSGEDEICPPTTHVVYHEMGKTSPDPITDQYQFHGKILGLISILLLFMLICCIIYSIKQSKLDSENQKRINQDNNLAISEGDFKNENKPKKMSISSTKTLTTDVLSKKIYQSKPKNLTYKEIKIENDRISIESKEDNYFGNTESQNKISISNGDLCVSQCEKMSKSISSMNKQKNHKTNEHLPGCKSLPSFSTESVKTLFDKKPHPVVEKRTVSKPLVRIKYYA